MASFNKVLLMGNLTRDPELRHIKTGTPVADVGLAVNRTFKNAQGQKEEKPCFVDVTFWSKQAELVAQYLKKGSPIFVEGRLELDSWTTEDGQKRNKLRVVAENFQFINAGGRGASAGGSPGRDAEDLPAGPGGDLPVPKDDDIPF